MDAPGKDCPVLPDFADARCTRIVTLLAQGAMPAAIARDLDCSIRTVWNLRSANDLDAIAAALATDIAIANGAAMRHHLTRAIEVQAECMEHPEDDGPVPGEDTDMWEARQRVRLARDKLRQTASKEIASWTIKATELQVQRETGGQRGDSKVVEATTETLVAHVLASRRESGD